MIFLLETRSKSAARPNLLTIVLRGLTALVLIVVGLFVFSVAATAVLIIGGVLSLAGVIWWQFAGKKRVAELMRKNTAQFSAAAPSFDRKPAARSGVVIEGELIK